MANNNQLPQAGAGAGAAAPQANQPPLPLGQITIFGLMERTGTQEHCLAFLQERSLLHPTLNCQRCGGAMRIENDRSKVVCPYVWRCAGANCRGKTSVLDGSYFQLTHIPLPKHVLLSYYWASETPVHVTASHLDVDQDTVVQWYQYARDICSWKLTHLQITLGGVGIIVQVDESVMVKAKYHRGRNLNRRQQWVFGAYDTTSKLGYVCFVAQRNAATLLPIIQQYVLNTKLI